MSNLDYTTVRLIKRGDYTGTHLDFPDDFVLACVHVSAIHYTDDVRLRTLHQRNGRP